MKKHRAFHIDAAAQTVMEVMIEDKHSLDILQKLVGGYIEVAVRLDNQDVIYVDEEGLLKKYEVFFEYEGAHQPFAGNGVMVGTNSKGADVDCKTTLEELKAKIAFYSLEEIRKKYV